MEPLNQGQLGAAPNKVVPLLAALSRAEELTSAIVFRLDPITNHTNGPAIGGTTAPPPPSNTVTGRINQLGDALQYLLDNIEL